VKFAGCVDSGLKECPRSLDNEGISPMVRKRLVAGATGAAAAMGAGGMASNGAAGGSAAGGPLTVAPQLVQNCIPSTIGAPHFVQN